MKVSKINTSSFAVSRDMELDIRRMAESDAKNKDNKITLEGKYAPLAKFKVTRQEKVVSGSVEFLGLKKSKQEEKTNFFYVNLNNAHLYNVSGKSRNGVELGEIDFFERLLSIPSKAISTLGYLVEYGSTKKEELDSGVLDELLTHGLADEYVYERNIFVEYVLREVGDFVGSIPEGRRNLVRPAYKIPGFDNKTYNLSNFVEVDDTLEATYQKDTIKYSEDQISGVLATLFRGKTELIEITYLPYYDYGSIKRGVSERKQYMLLCPRGGVRMEYPHPLKLRPMSLYSMEVGAKVIPIEGDVITFEDIADLSYAKDEIKRKVVYPFQNASELGEASPDVSGGILFYGPPGCGKTYLAKATVGEIGISFITANIEDIMGEGIDMAAKKLHDVFDYARNAAPCVLFFDEIDTVASRRDISSSTALVNQLLTEMDGVLGLGKDILIIGATNMPWRLDPALLRGGRFTEQIYIKPPEFDSRVEMFDIYLKKRSDVSPGVSARELASLTEYYSASDIKTIVDRAAMFSLESSVQSKAKKHRIQQWHLIQALKERKPSLVAWFKFAEKQMEIEGAKESYPELWADIQKFKRDFDKIKAGGFEEQTDLTKMMEAWKKEESEKI